MCVNYGGRAEIADAAALDRHGRSRRGGSIPTASTSEPSRVSSTSPTCPTSTCSSVVRRAAHLELLALAERLRRAGLPRRALARRRPPSPVAGLRALRRARPSLRRRRPEAPRCANASVHPARARVPDRFELEGAVLDVEVVGRHAPSASSTRPAPLSARTASETTTWADSTGMPEVIVHTWRSWTPTTPGVPGCVRGRRGRCSGRGLEQDVNGLAKEQPDAGHDHDGHRDRCDGVGPQPTCGHDDDGGRDGSDGAQHVTQDLEVGTANVEVDGGAVPQQEDAGDVGDQAEDCDAEHDPGLDWFGLLHLCPASTTTNAATSAAGPR